MSCINPGVTAPNNVNRSCHAIRQRAFDMPERSEVELACRPGHEKGDDLRIKRKIWSTWWCQDLLYQRVWFQWLRFCWVVLQGYVAKAGAGGIYLGSLWWTLLYHECFGCIIYCFKKHLVYNIHTIATTSCCHNDSSRHAASRQLQYDDAFVSASN